MYTSGGFMGPLEQIYNSAIKFLETQTLESTYSTAVEEAIKLTQADYGTILLGHNDTLHRVYTNIPLKHHTEPRKNGFAYKAFKTGKTQILSSETIGEIHPNLLKTGIKSSVIIPLIYHRKAIGVLTVESKSIQHFTKERLEMIRVFGGLVSLAIQKTQLYHEATTALKTRDLFISTAGHELRTPTTSILGYGQMMLKKYDKGEFPPRKWAEILYAETVRLNNMLRELLQIEQIKLGQFKYEWKDNSLAEIADRAIAYAEVSHPNYKFKLENNLEKKNDLLYSDFDKILQTLIILINNAVKFSPEQSTIKIGLDSDDNSFLLRVRDQGQGISDEDLPHVFEGFYKGKANKKEGFGLGLFLAENIINRHNGSISVKSKIGKGTLMEITLPKK